MRTFVSILAVLVLLVGLAPLADAQSQTVTGHITQVDVKNQVVKIRPQGGGAEVQLITTGIPADTIKALKVGDRVTATVRDNSTRKSGTMMDVTSIAAASGRGSSAAASSSNGWQQIHGVVRDVQGSTLTLRADDGRRLTVDMAKVGPDIQKNLQRGDRVTVAATDVSANNVRAEFIQKDSSAGVQPSASAPPPANSTDWQKIHGEVRTVDGSTFTFRADDGRQLTVDMSKVGPDIQKSLQRGDRVTVATHDVTGNNVKAEFVQKDSSAGVQPSASPAQK